MVRTGEICVRYSPVNGIAKYQTMNNTLANSGSVKKIAHLKTLIFDENYLKFCIHNPS